MTTKIIFGSNKLGHIEDGQLQSMLNTFNLGKLISSRRTDNGAMGQTMFVSSTEGDFILKGNPLYPGQFIEEKFFIENIKQRSDIPVPTPYMIDDSTDIYGWSYAIMPRLRGSHINELRPMLSNDDKLKIIESIAITLLSFHQWEVNDYGELNTETLEIIPFEETYNDWLCNRIRYWLEDAKKYSEISSADINWVEALLFESKEQFNKIASPTFVMGDFKPGNSLVDKEEEQWKVSGVFDFTNSYFGDPLADLAKMIIYFLDNKERELAIRLLEIYKSRTNEQAGFKKRLNVHMLHQLVLNWGSAKATKMVSWNDELALSEWAARYIGALEGILD